MDLHCHFRKKNIFIYGCEGDEDDPTAAGTTAANNANVKAFPNLLSQRAPCFSFSDCSFKVCNSIGVNTLGLISR